MDAFRQRRASAPSQFFTPPRSQSIPTHLQPASSHPYASNNSGATSLTNSYDARQAASPARPSPWRSSASSAQQRSRSACVTSADVTFTSALQQQYETTRLLSRLFAGVTLQWRQVVEQLNEAGVPLTAENVVKGTPVSFAPPSQPSTNADNNSSNDDNNSSTRNYLREGLHFDVQALNARRERERQHKSLRQERGQRRRTLRHDQTHPYGRRADFGDDAIYKPATEQQLDHYLQAEEDEVEELERQAERAAAATTGAADWSSLTPSAEWVPYVVGKSRADQSDETWFADRYDGVLYASPDVFLKQQQQQDRYRSAWSSRTRCTLCDDETKMTIDLDDEARLRTAVLHGMARSAEKMVMGMRQVQQILPASAAALRARTPSRAATPQQQRTLTPHAPSAYSVVCPEGMTEVEDKRTPTRRHWRHGKDELSQLARTQPAKSAEVPLQRRRQPHQHAASPLPRSPLNLSPPPPQQQQPSQLASPKSHLRRSLGAGDTAEVAHYKTAKTIYPALPAAQRTWIYPRLDDSANNNNKSGSGNNESSKVSSTRHKSLLHERHDHRDQHGHQNTPPPSETRRAQSTSKSTTCTLALHGVTPIAESSSVGVSITTDVHERSREKRVAAAAAAAVNDTLERRRCRASPPQLQVQRQLDWRKYSSGQQAAQTARGEAKGSFWSEDGSSSRHGERGGRRGSKELPLIPMGRALSEVQQAHLSALVHAETEARLRIAVYHESSMNSVLQAHYHQLWSLRNGGGGDTAYTSKTAAEKEERECTTQNEGGAAPSSDAAAPPVGTTSATAATLSMPAVSVSPLTSPPASPQSAPVGADVNVNNMCRDEIRTEPEDVATAADNPLCSPAAEPTPVTAASDPAQSLAATQSDSDSVFSVHSPDIDEIELSGPPSRSASGQHGAPASPSPPPSTSSKRTSPLYELPASPMQQVARSPSPPPPPEERTPPPPKQSTDPAIAAAAAARISLRPAVARVLMSPLDERASQARKRCAHQWDIRIPPGDALEPKETNSANSSTFLAAAETTGTVGTTAHDHAWASVQKYVQHGGSSALCPSAVSPVVPRSGGRRVAEWFPTLTKSATSTVPPGEPHVAAAENEHRGGVVALELFPPKSLPKESPSPQRERQKQLPLLSPLPVIPPLLPTFSAAKTAKECTNEHELSLYNRGEEREPGHENVIDQSVHSKERGHNAAAAAAAAALPASASKSTRSDNSALSAEGSSYAAHRSSSHSSSSCSNSNTSQLNTRTSSSIRYEAENASPLAPDVEDVEEVTNYSSISSFCNSLPECLAVVETAGTGTSSSAEFNNTDSASTKNKKGAVPSDLPKVLLLGAAPEFEHIIPTETCRDYLLKAEVPSPPPRPPMP